MANKAICGMLAYCWSQEDQHAANIQASERNAASLHQDMQQQHMKLRVRLHDEEEARRIDRDRMVMVNARNAHTRPRTVSNASLAQQIFGLTDYHQAKKLCEKMGFDPKSIRCEVVKK